MTTVLSPAEVGRLNLITAIYGWYLLVLVNPVGMYVNRNIITWDQNGTAKSNISRYLLYLTCVSAFSIASLSLIGRFTDFGLELNALPFTGIIAIGIFVLGASASVISYFNLLDARISFVMFSNILSWGAIFGSFIFVSSLEPKAEIWLAGQILTSAIVLGIAFTALNYSFKKPPPTIIPEAEFSAKNIFSFGAPLAVSVLCYWIQTQGYRFVVMSFSGEKILGQFVINFGLGVSLMATFESFVTQFYLPILYRGISSNEISMQAAAWNKYAAFLFPITIVAMATVASNSSAIAAILLGSEFRGASSLIAWGSIAECLRISYSAFAVVAHARMTMKSLIIPGLIGAIVSVAGVGLLAPKFELHGIAFGLILGYAVAIVDLQRRMLGQLPIKIPWTAIRTGTLLALPFGIIIWFDATTRVGQIVTITLSLVYCGMVQIATIRRAQH